MKYVNKKMVIAINKLCIELTGGEELGGKTNMYEGQSLGFVEGIVINKIFGKKRYKTIFHQAAAYLYFILKNHPFVDGNSMLLVKCDTTNNAGIKEILVNTDI